MYYFAYGSLLNRDRIAELSSTARPASTGRIPHHALCYTGHSQRWGGGTATIGLAPASYLWGGVYEIDETGRAAIENSGADDGYAWAVTGVETGDGERLRVGMLVKVRDFERVDPSAAYLEVLKAGWRQWGLDPKIVLHDVPPTL
jgi:hypothetical protein